MVGPKLSSVRILQIGDMHFNKDSLSKVEADSKESGLAASTMMSIGGNRFRKVSAQIVDEVCEQGHSLLLFMGDLTDRAQKENYDNCLSFIKEVVVNQISERGKNCAVRIIPGNHDINRSEHDPEDPKSKFIPLLEAIENHGFETFGDDQFTMFDIEHDGGTSCLRVYLLNTCLGAGERREFRAEVLDIIGRFDEEDSEAEFPKLAFVREILDAPIIDADAIDSLCADIKKLPAKTLAVVAGHHNLLPQALPRVSPFSEMLNAGRLRSSLLALNRPILYLHGHIHENPIEQVREPIREESNLIIVSAPQFSEGYNNICITYDSNGYPVKATIDAELLANTGRDQRRKLDIPLVDRNRIVGELSKNDTEVYSSIPSVGPHYFSDCYRDYQNKMRDEALDLDDYQSRLLQMESLGILKIGNMLRDVDSWRLQKVE